MKYTFSIHGVPSGNQVWGNIHDSEYLRSFYNSVSADSAPTQMIVDIRYSENKVCSYYHYLRLSNIDNSKSRTGSYYGMTICFEGMYCSNFEQLYKLFDACFNQVVVGQLLVKSGDRLKYSVEDFSSDGGVVMLNDIKNGINSNISIFEESMKTFPNAFSPKHRSDNFVEQWSLDDVGNQTFINVLLRDAMASVSPHYPVSYKKVEMLQSDNRAKNAKINSLEAEKATLIGENNNLQQDVAAKGQVIREQNSEIEKQNVAINTLSSDKKTLQNELDKAKNEISKLQEDLNYARSNMDDETLRKCFDQLKAIAERRAQTDLLLNAMEPRLEQVKDLVGQIDKQINPDKKIKLGKIHILVIVVVLLAIVAAVIFLCPSSKTGVSFDPSVEQKPQITSTGVTEHPMNENREEQREEIVWDGYKLARVDIKEAKKKNEITCIPVSRELHLTAVDVNYGGGKFRMKYHNTDWIEIESKDNGLTAVVNSIGVGYINTVVEFDYFFNGKSYQPREVMVSDL